MKYSCYVLTEQFLCNLWWTFCNGLFCHTVYMEFVCICKHCNITGLRQSPGKTFCGPGKYWNFL